MIRTILLVFLAACILAPRLAFAITIPTVPVGNVGNIGDPHPNGHGPFGAVEYNYRIGTYEVTVGQYAEFLNAVAKTDTYALYNTSMAGSLFFNVPHIVRSGVSGDYSYSVVGSPNKPITYVNWGDAARFANWMHNGQPTGSQDASTTESGAYELNGALTIAALSLVTRASNATWFIPTEDEWYKAAFHMNDGATGNYWDYPTSTNAVPYSDQPPGTGSPTMSNSANFFKNDAITNGYDDGYAVTGMTNRSNIVDYLTDVGAYSASSSPYGTFDQGGNVWEWNETIDDTARGVRGGSWDTDSFPLLATSGYSLYPTLEGPHHGFRLATVAEPSSVTLIAAGIVLLVAFGRRKRA
jgi:formylglycine-generating enzyme required for sulfatase activity